MQVELPMTALMPPLAVWPLRSIILQIQLICLINNEK